MTQFGGAGGSFGPNAWLVDDMYDRFLADPSSVSESWREFFTDYRPAPVPAPPPQPLAQPRSGVPPAVAVPAAAPVAARTTVAVNEEATPLRGAASRIVANMEASLAVPTATSVRTVPARLLEVNRLILNNQLARTTGAKVSFTHVIGYAVVRALHDVPALNSAFVADADGTGKPGVVHHKHVGLGLAVDQEKSDGSRTLLVPVIKDADTLDFRSFVLAYEDLIRKIATNKIAPDDFAGATVSLTNPGTLGNRAVGAPPDAGPGRHHRGRGARIPGRVRGGRSASGRPAGTGQGGHAHLDIRPPHHPGGGVWPVPGPGGRSLDRHRRLLRRLVRVHGRALRARSLAGGQQRRRRQRGERAPAPGEAGPCGDADQHVPGARPPHRAISTPSTPSRRTSTPSSTR